MQKEAFNRLQDAQRDLAALDFAINACRILAYDGEDIDDLEPVE